MKGSIYSHTRHPSAYGYSEWIVYSCPPVPLLVFLWIELGRGFNSPSQNTHFISSLSHLIASSLSAPPALFLFTPNRVHLPKHYLTLPDVCLYQNPYLLFTPFLNLPTFLLTYCHILLYVSHSLALLPCSYHRTPLPPLSLETYFLIPVLITLSQMTTPHSLPATHFRYRCKLCFHTDLPLLVQFPSFANSP